MPMVQKIQPFGLGDIQGGKMKQGQIHFEKQNLKKIDGAEELLSHHNNNNSALNFDFLCKIIYILLFVCLCEMTFKNLEDPTNYYNNIL